MIDWAEIDTVLLDMDGTLLDLRFDNVLWNEHLPERYASARQIGVEDAREHLFAHMREKRTRLEFYCIDHWSRFTSLDIVALHRELDHLIQFRPHAQRFLAAARAAGKRLVLVTNAHRASLGIKDARTGLVAALHRAVSSHDLEAPKESQEFWSRLAKVESFAPARTLLVDDNADVLDAAGDFGIGHLRTVAQPDSARPARTGLRHRTIAFEEALP
jgi:HAD superfamily hydrolase (TIGR01509 family)